MGKMKELYTTAQETQIDPLDVEDDRFDEPPPDPEMAAHVAALARDLEGR